MHRTDSGAAGAAPIPKLKRVWQQAGLPPCFHTAGIHRILRIRCGAPAEGRAELRVFVPASCGLHAPAALGLALLGCFRDCRYAHRPLRESLARS